MAGILASRLLGLVREQVVALYFGRSGELSAYWAAFRIPNLFRVLLGEGNLSASFIPVLSGQFARGDVPAGRRTAGVLLGFLLVGVAVFTLAGIALAPALAFLAAPGFDGPLRELVTRLLRILFPLAGLLVLGAWCMGVLHAHGRFFLPNFAPVFLSVVSALSLVLFLGRWDRAPIELLAWGTLAGGVVQLLVQLPACASVLGELRPRLARDEGFRRVALLFTPLLLGTGVAQINALVETQIASFLDAEAVATLQYAVRLYTLPLSLFGTSVAMAALPALAHDSAADAGTSRLVDGIAAAWVRALFFLVPSTVALAAFGEPLVRVVFERGAFSPDDTRAVTAVLALYALGLPAFATVRILSQGFYALEDSRTPTRLSVIALGLNTALSALLAWAFGTPGIALASTLAALVSALLLGRALRRRVGGGWLRGPARRLAALVLAGAAAAAAGAALVRLLPEAPATVALVPALLRLAALYGGIGATYLSVAALAGALPRPTRTSGAGRDGLL